jgi:hypothetical protein
MRLLSLSTCATAFLPDNYNNDKCIILDMNGRKMNT